MRAASVEVPAALSDVAADGVAQLSTLQAEIPDAARAALAAARATETDGGLGGFLKRQLGARSVAPREGDDPHAVLSRLEAAVREGRLDAALAEAEALPSEAQAAMQDWIDAAQARVDAQSATEALVQRVAAN